jgi:hypothetical protein
MASSGLGSPRNRVAAVSKRPRLNSLAARVRRILAGPRRAERDRASIRSIDHNATTAARDTQNAKDTADEKRGEPADVGGEG